jgi:hypothetical protein
MTASGVKISRERWLAIGICSAVPTKTNARQAGTYDMHKTVQSSPGGLRVGGGRSSKCGIEEPEWSQPASEIQKQQ